MKEETQNQCQYSMTSFMKYTDLFSVNLNFSLKAFQLTSQLGSFLNFSISNMIYWIKSFISLFWRNK